MLVSHRRHSPSLGNTRLAIDRAISPSFLVKRVRLRDVAQDERLTKAFLGVDSHHARSRLLLVLRGRTIESVDGVETLIGAGRALYVSDRQPYASVSHDCDVLELEWDPGALEDGALGDGGSFSLSALAHCRVLAMADHLGEAPSAAAIRGPFADLLRILRAEGIPLDPERVLSAPHATLAEQQLMTHIDRSLSDLANAPMLVDLEGTLESSRRTLTRNIQRLHERYGLLGRGGGRWRGIRDVYRLVLAAILLSHEEATPRRVAGLVGYTSVEALDHAFRNSALPSPTALRRSLLSTLAA